MIVFSLVAAIVIWWIVASGPNNITTQEIDITVPITLSNSLAQENNLRVIGNETEVKVRVTVQGARWVVGQLKELENIQVRANTSNIINPGYHEEMCIRDSGSHVRPFCSISLPPENDAVISSG